MNAPSQHERTFPFRASAPEEREKGASMRRTAVDVSSVPGPARLGSTGRARTPGTRPARTRGPVPRPRPRGAPRRTGSGTWGDAGGCGIGLTAQAGLSSSLRVAPGDAGTGPARPPRSTSRASSRRSTAMRAMRRGGDPTADGGLTAPGGRVRPREDTRAGRGRARAGSLILPGGDGAPAQATGPSRLLDRRSRRPRGPRRRRPRDSDYFVSTLETGASAHRIRHGPHSPTERDGLNLSILPMT